MFWRNWNWGQTLAAGCNGSATILSFFVFFFFHGSFMIHWLATRKLGALLLTQRPLLVIINSTFGWLPNFLLRQNKQLNQCRDGSSRSLGIVPPGLTHRDTQLTEKMLNSFFLESFMSSNFLKKIFQSTLKSHSCLASLSPVILAFPSKLHQTMWVGLHDWMTRRNRLAAQCVDNVNKKCDTS